MKYTVQILAIFLIGTAICHLSCTNILNPETEFIFEEDVFGKQKGAHIFGSLDTSNVHNISNYNLDWVAFVPWGFQPEYDSKALSNRNRDSIQIKINNEAWLRQIKVAHDQGFKVFFKPHVWMNTSDEGKWRSDIYPASDENWEAWKESYRDFILRYAKLAQQAKVELFCMGVEFTKLTAEKSKFWIELIDEIREVYKGKITYAANWYKELDHIEFWDKLDYIGVQAYFPLTKNESPTVEELNKGWSKYIPNFERTSEKYGKKIIFTEMGYKSTTDSAIEPWKWIEYRNDNNAPLSTVTQANCYTSFFETIWNQDWFAGVYIWQMRADHKPNHGKNDLDFTPQSKPAQQIITKAFGRK